MIDVCNFLNLAALVENKIFCVHGGPSPKNDRLDNIRSMNRLIEHQEFFNKHLGIVTGRPDEGTEG